MADSVHFNDNDFGDVFVSFRRDMRSLTARWRDSHLHINVPLGTPQQKVLEFIDNNRSRLANIRPAMLTYSFGQRIHCFRHTVSIIEHNGKKSQIGYGSSPNGLYVSLSPEVDLSLPTVSRTISACLSRLMADRAADTLITYANQVAREIGVAPDKFVIGRGMRKLGHCTTNRVIQLSFNIMFFPEELVRYIICHELAHLSEMNHGPRFHALCNAYCNGREKSLALALKAFSWPIIR